MENPPMQVTGFNALSEQQQQEHRAKIGVRVHGILNGFWKDSGTPDAVKAIEVEGWMDVLENFSHSDIRYAWRDYQNDKKNFTENGRLARPHAGALRLIILRKIPKPRIVETPEPEGDPPATKEEAAAIMEEYGYKPKRFGGDE